METQKTNAFVLVENGRPDEVGRTFPLAGALVLGGCWGSNYQPDIGFSDRRVSRRHASIVCSGVQFVLTDLHSTWGTRLNERPMTKGMPYVLKNDDKINLANRVVLRFCQELPSEPTGATHDDLSEVLSPVIVTRSGTKAIVVDDERKEILVEGKRLEQVRGDSLEYRLLSLLYQNQGRAVGYDAIRQWGWPDRQLVDSDSGRVSFDVDLGEIEQVVYRLRRKLGKFGSCVQNVPRYGYMLN